ncbi:DUF3097 domain-containing protein [Actinobacteria bacterium YIM 96077]|uniref:DUF3097 domain-containing protein n=1 Tax=Phytoactinopolyspora halophila TaxID=1981511 RepID=A0A329QFD4_9ACTN|nr:DUF3097 domain-containing protein [Actinobacteria bacterium YIM 96077]RAW11020.1 DUF3097 domain-containing protein [Phytoactinopolyspora halophila]
MPDRYGPDVLARSPHPKRPTSVETAAEPGLVVEDAQSGFCGAVVECDKHGVTLEDRHGNRRAFPLGPGFWIDGKPVALVRPNHRAPTKPSRTASGSRPVEKQRARVARESRIYVEGKHDAELVEKIWGDDLRVEGVVVEELGGADDLMEIVRDFRPDATRRLGVLLDHMVEGTKEARIAGQVAEGPLGDHVLIVGHPYVDIWQAVRPSVLGIDAWPTVPRGVPWKEGVIDALGWSGDPPAVWRRIRESVTTYTDLEPAFLGRVEELIDFVTAAESA